MADGNDPISGGDEVNRTEGAEDNASKPTLGDKKGSYLKKRLVYQYCLTFVCVESNGKPPHSSKTTRVEYILGCMPQMSLQD